MSPVKITTLSLGLAGLIFSHIASANLSAEDHQTAVTVVAMAQICNKAQPDLNGTVDNMLAHEPMEDAMRKEIIAVNTEPRYKGEVDSMVHTLANSAIADVAVKQGTCKAYSAK